MKNIIQVRKLYKNNSNISFGYVGRVLETGETKYYYFNNEDNNTTNRLHEFDINNVSNSYIMRCLSECNLERPKFSPLLPTELKEQLKEIINKHKRYNQENDLPTTCIEKNTIDLSVQIIKNNGFRRTRPPAAQYSTLGNRIEVGKTQKEWEILSEEEKEREKSHLIHEVGHLKAAKCFLTDNILNVRTGFDIVQYNISPIRLENGDIFYKIENRILGNIIRIEEILEEIMNDADCHNAFSSFHKNYSDFGEQLNNLCDGKLLIARYTNGIDEYYDRMYDIIPDRDLATELLETIYAATYGTSREKTEENAKKIVKRYEETKRKK